MTAAAKFLSRVAGALVEPAPSITDVGERRRVRLLATLELVQLVQLIVSGSALALTEHGASRIALPMVLFGAVPFTIINYYLTRSRHAATGIIGHVLLNLALSPIVPLVDPQSNVFISFAFIIPAILMANVATSARTTFLAGAGALLVMVVVTKGFGPPSRADDIRHGIIFVSVGLTLIVAFGIHRDRLEADRSAELRTRNAELEALRQTLEQKVIERTRELSASNVEMRLVLDSVAQGLFTIDAAGLFTSEPSAALTTWFGPSRQGESFVAYLGGKSSRFAVSAELAWAQVADGVLPLEVALAQVPSTLVADGRHFRLSFEPIQVGEHEQFLVVVSDITNEIERDRMQRERRETFALFEHMLADRSQFVEFMAEASALVSRVLSPTAENGSLQRDLHTLKGTALLFGLESVGEICHDLESRLAEEQRLPNASERAVLETRWAALTSEVDRLLGDRRHTVELTSEQYRSLERAVRDARPREELLRLVLDFKLEPVEPRLRNFAEQTQRIAARLGKEVTIEIEDEDALRVDGAKWAPLWPALVHAVRNAIDHGIEVPSERRAAGKPARGRIAFRAARSEAVIAIEVRDDGRGIDWDQIRERAAARGSNVDSRDAIQAILFAGGVSTAQEVTDLSGRGVGMNALSAVVRELGGSIQLDSTKGAGTLVRLSFPTPTAAA